MRLFLPSDKKGGAGGGDDAEEDDEDGNSAAEQFQRQVMELSKASEGGASVTIAWEPV